MFTPHLLASANQKPVWSHVIKGNQSECWVGVYEDMDSCQRHWELAHHDLVLSPCHGSLYVQCHFIMVLSIRDDNRVGEDSLAILFYFPYKSKKLVTSYHIQGGIPSTSVECLFPFILNPKVLIKLFFFFMYKWRGWQYSLGGFPCNFFFVVFL